MNPEITARQATQADIPFLAWCNVQATSPAPEFCYWDPLLAHTKTSSIAFMEAVFQTNALAWGQVEEFFILEQAGKPIAGASAFTMSNTDYRPLQLECLPAIAQHLSWNQSATVAFQEAYEQVWHDPLDPSLAPHTSWIIECVAVIPEARGRGMTRKLFQALFAEGQKRGHTHVGISVTTGNQAAQRAYEAIGFQLYLQYGAEYFDHAFPGTTKYRMRLKTQGDDQ